MIYREELPSRGYSFLKKGLLMAGGLVMGFILSRIFIITYIINDSSMLPALTKGERVFISTMSSLNRGDIVLTASPLEPGTVYVKRIIAVENDIIEIIHKKIFINKSEFVSPWGNTALDRRIFPAAFTYRDNMPPLKIGGSEYFLIGDNLDNSFDSRSFGIIHKKSIKGRMIYKF